MIRFVVIVRAKYITNVRRILDSGERILLYIFNYALTANLYPNTRRLEDKNSRINAAIFGFATKNIARISYKRWKAYRGDTHWEIYWMKVKRYDINVNVNKTMISQLN